MKELGDEKVGVVTSVAYLSNKRVIINEQSDDVTINHVLNIQTPSFP